MNAAQHVVAAEEAMLDERPGLAEYHQARAELVAARTRRVAAPVSPLALLVTLGAMVADRLDDARAQAAGYGYWSGYQDAAGDRAYSNPWRNDLDGTSR